jgi:ABC-type transport system substrate-binding protein
MGISSSDEAWQKMGELVQSQWREFGIDCQIEILEDPILISSYTAGEIPVMLMPTDWAEGGSFLIMMFHSQTYNVTFSNDPQMEEVLNTINATIDPDARQEAVDNAVLYIMENAYVITAVAKPEFIAISNLMDGVIMDPVWHDPYMTEIYFK